MIRKRGEEGFLGTEVASEFRPCPADEIYRTEGTGKGGIRFHFIACEFIAFKL
jgi:hypothetical protein